MMAAGETSSNDGMPPPPPPAAAASAAPKKSSSKAKGRKARPPVAKPYYRGNVTVGAEDGSVVWKGQWALSEEAYGRGEGQRAPFEYRMVAASASASASASANGTAGSSDDAQQTNKQPPASGPRDGVYEGWYLYRDQVPPSKYCEHHLKMTFVADPQNEGTWKAYGQGQNRGKVGEDGNFSKPLNAFYLCGTWSSATGEMVVQKGFGRAPKSAQPPRPPKSSSKGKGASASAAAAAVHLATSRPRSERKRKAPKKLGNEMDNENVRLSEPLRKMKSILKQLQSDDRGGFFAVPVDPVALNLKVITGKDYFKIVKRPMDLGTVYTKLTSGEYSTHEEFAEDVRLTFNNAILFNSMQTEVYRAAEVYLDKFNDKYNAYILKLEQKKPPPPPPPPPPAAKSSSSSSSSSSSRSRKRDGERKHKRRRRDYNDDASGAGRGDSGDERGGGSSSSSRNGGRLSRPRKNKGKSKNKRRFSDDGSRDRRDHEIDMLRRQMIQMGQLVQRMSDERNMWGMGAGGGMMNPQAMMSAGMGTSPIMHHSGGMMGGMGVGAPAHPDLAAAATAAAAEATAARSGGKEKKKSKKGGAKQPKDLTFDQKRRLGQDINKLPGECLQRVVQIIEENSTVSRAPGDEEVEVDIDELDAGTLRKLQKYVRDALRRRANQSGKQSGGPTADALMQSVQQAASGASQRKAELQAALRGGSVGSAASGGGPHDGDDASDSDVSDDEDSEVRHW